MRFSRLSLCALASVTLLVVSGPALSQETRYIYDPLGRLIGVVDQDGRTTVYEYDAVGNLLTIRRTDISAPVEITFVNPNIGPPGAFVEILGIGFSDVPNQNRIDFNAISALVLASGRTRLVTQVPNGATSGPITVTTPSGSAVSPDIFRVPRIAISPAPASVIVGKQRQFRATVVDSPDGRVFWTVDGIEGGNATVGTITLDGLYTAPTDVPSPDTVRIQAVSAVVPGLFAEADVTVVPSQGFVVAGPSDVRVIRPGTGGPGGLPLNLTVGEPKFIRVARPGIGDPGGLPTNIAVAAPSLISVARPGTGDTSGIPSNITVADPATLTVVRPGTGDSGTHPPNVTVARPDDVKVKRQ